MFGWKELEGRKKNRQLFLSLAGVQMRSDHLSPLFLSPGILSKGELVGENMDGKAIHLKSEITISCFSILAGFFLTGQLVIVDLVG